MKTERILVTGGAGFIGSNLVDRLLTQGHEVIIYDNLSRAGCQQNLQWLRTKHGAESFCLVEGELVDVQRVQGAAQRVQRIYHLAGQLAVTTAVNNPRQDFEANALGTFNVLESARLVADDPLLIYASTNKVYGGMEGIRIVEGETRYAYADFPFGIPETQPLDFHSPYGCSKGSGDQYTRDYARIYQLRTVVARQSCIYGYRQFGIEEQGWLAWFTIAALKQRPISIYGNGKQVRDALFVDDLLDAYEAIVHNIDQAAGRVYNIGGGPENTISVWCEFGQLLQQYLGRAVTVRKTDWRPGDQPVYVSDIRKAKAELGWEPKVSIRQGTQKLFEWIEDNQALFQHF